MIAFRKMVSGNFSEMKVHFNCSLEYLSNEIQNDIDKTHYSYI